MYVTIPEIDTRTKMFKFIYFTDLILLTVTGLILWSTKNILISVLRIPYFIFGMLFVIYLIRDSEDNVGKKKIHSVFYFLKRNRNLVKSQTEEKKELKNKIDERKELRKRKKRIKNIDKDLLDYQFFISIDENGILRHKDNTFVKILKIETIDVLNLKDEDINKIISEYTLFFKKYLLDLKIVSMRFPCNFRNQIEFLKEKLNAEKNEFRKKFLNLKLQELEFLENTSYNLEFYLYIFSADYDDLIRGLESMKKDFPTRLSELEKEKQEKIIFKLNNLNTKILK